jgi:glycosidase
MNDHFSIDDEYGTMDDLRVLVKKAHEADMHVLLDLVYAHIGNSADIIKRHPEFVMQNQDGSFVCTEWNFPKLDFNNEGLREYLYCNMVYYISVIDVDGFRCDVGDCIPIDFWNEAKKRILRVKSDAVLINEGLKYYYMETAFDACYCFDWHKCVRKVFCGTDSASTIKELYENLDLPKGGKLLRDIDNHDTVTDWIGRTETVCGHNGMEQIEVINYLMDGIPMVYAGNELACEAHLSMFANRFFPGSFDVTDRNDKYSEKSKRRQEVIRILNKLKAEQDLLHLGKTVWMETSMPDEVICFKRVLDGEEIMFIGNVKNFEVDIDITIPEERKCVLTNRKNLLSSGKLCLGPYEYAVFM